MVTDETLQIECSFLDGIVFFYKRGISYGMPVEVKGQPSPSSLTQLPQSLSCQTPSLLTLYPPGTLLSPLPIPPQACRRDDTLG